MKSICALLVLISALSGCALYTPGGAVIVDPAGGVGKGGSQGGGNFCPPGQAKKGRC